MECNYKEKLDIFVDAIVKHGIDVIALQEVMQPIECDICKSNHINCGKIPLKKGNHALNITNALKKRGLSYNLAWIGFKKSYDRFDEGLAILTPHEISQATAITLTSFDDYNNWKTRKALGVKILGNWYYSVHFGWWDSFETEFQSLIKKMVNNEQAWLMGDFNSVAAERNKGYDLVVSNGWYDTYSIALNKDEGMTAHSGIDGWNGDNTEIRIDYIFTNKKAKIDSSFVIFNGKNERIISDHYGIILSI